MQICVIGFLHGSSSRPGVPVRSDEQDDSYGKQENDRRNQPSLEAGAQWTAVCWRWRFFRIGHTR